MIRNFVILCALIACAGLYTFLDGDAVPSGQTIASSVNGIPVQDFTFETLDGEAHSLSDYKGKVVVLNFWASWCAPCIIEFPSMLKLAASAKKESVFIFLSLDADEKNIGKFLFRYGKDLPKNVVIARDKDMRISKDIFGTYRLPETFILSRDLVIAEKIVGADMDWNGMAMQQKIKNLYAENDAVDGP